MSSTPARNVAHIVEIRISDTDPWTVCDVYAHPIEKSVATTVSNIATKVQAHNQSHGDRCETTTTRTLDGVLVRAEINVDHDSGGSFFRHTICPAWAPGPWLSVKATTPTPEHDY